MFPSLSIAGLGHCYMLHLDRTKDINVSVCMLMQENSCLVPSKGLKVMSLQVRIICGSCSPDHVAVTAVCSCSNGSEQFGSSQDTLLSGPLPSTPALWMIYSPSQTLLPREWYCPEAGGALPVLGVGMQQWENGAKSLELGSPPLTAANLIPALFRRHPPPPSPEAAATFAWSWEKLQESSINCGY